MSDLFTIPPLPYEYSALASKGMTEENLKFHRDVHHQGYATKLNAAAKNNAELAKKSIEQMILTEKGPIFNLAAQIWNHSFFFKCLSPIGGGQPSGRIAEEINASFGDFAKFKEQFNAVSMAHFGSGWTWLVHSAAEKKLKIVDTHDAGCPLTEGGLKPILVIDLWEHAFYPSYGPKKADYLEFFWRSVNWQFAEQNLLNDSKQ